MSQGAVSLFPDDMASVMLFKKTVEKVFRCFDKEKALLLCFVKMSR